MQAASDRQSAKAGCNDARGVPAAGFIGKQHGPVDVNSSDINATLPLLMTSDTQGRLSSCPSCKWGSHTCMHGSFCMQSYLVAILCCARCSSERHEVW